MVLALAELLLLRVHGEPMSLSAHCYYDAIELAQASFPSSATTHLARPAQSALGTMYVDR
jgi:hypothetical protein